MLSMQDTVGRAGYGVDPRYAFDFRNYSCPSWSAAAPCRDSISGPDEIVFVTRDPGYYWAGTPTSTVQGCDPPRRVPAAPGRFWGSTPRTSPSTPRAATPSSRASCLEMTCAKGTNPSLGRVGTTAKATSAGGMQITLDAAVAGNPYRTNLAAGHDPCFDGGGAAPNANAAAGVSAFFVNRYRYHVASVNGEPWLMLDRGLDYNQNGTTAEKLASGTPDTDDEVPIARGVEGLQIAYLLRPSTTGIAAPDNGADWIVGNTLGTLEEPDPTATAPSQSSRTPTPRVSRCIPPTFAPFVSNSVIRSLRQDSAQPTPWAGDAPTPPGSTSIENRNDFTAVSLGRLPALLQLGGDCSAQPVLQGPVHLLGETRLRLVHPKHDRGSALIVAMILMIVLAVIGVAIVNRTTREVDAAASKRHWDRSMSCAEGARQMLLSQVSGLRREPRQSPAPEAGRRPAVRVGPLRQFQRHLHLGSRRHPWRGRGRRRLQPHHQALRRPGRKRLPAHRGLPGQRAGTHQQEIEFLVNFGF